MKRLSEGFFVLRELYCFISDAKRRAYETAGSHVMYIWARALLLPYGINPMLYLTAE